MSRHAKTTELVESIDQMSLETPDEVLQWFEDHEIPLEVRETNLTMDLKFSDITDDLDLNGSDKTEGGLRLFVERTQDGLNLMFTEGTVSGARTLRRLENDSIIVTSKRNESGQRVTTYYDQAGVELDPSEMDDDVLVYMSLDGGLVTLPFDEDIEPIGDVPDDFSTEVLEITPDDLLWQKNSELWTRIARILDDLETFEDLING